MFRIAGTKASWPAGYPGNRVPRVLHILPHRGGGAEPYLQLLAAIPGYSQDRLELASARTPRAAVLSIAARWPHAALRVRAAELVHVHGDAAALLTLPLLARTPSVWTTHGLHLLRRQPHVARGVRAVVSRTRVTICTSAVEARELVTACRAPADRLTVVPNGVVVPPRDEALRASARSELGLAEEDVAILFLGELEARKRPLDAVAATRVARAAGARVVLLLAGRGPLTDTVNAQAGDGVLALGFDEHPQRLLAACDVFVLPSSREGLSFALLEAMAHGLAPIVADGPGNGEAVGSTGIVVPTGDERALAEALGELARDRSRREALGAAARQRVEHEFTPQRLLDGVRVAYERALMAPGPVAVAASA